MHRKTIVILLLLLACCLSIQNAHGAMVKLSLDELVTQADLIVMGCVESVKSEMVEGKIFSFATVSVTSKIKGEPEATQDQVVVRFPGGTLGDVAMKVEDSPDYKQGEEVLLFLKRIENQPGYSTAGSSQGKFLIKNHIVVKENIPLDQFLERIQSLISSAR
jgi:hypothetical protein